MNTIEILLIVFGAVAFIGSFLVKGKQDGNSEPVSVDPDVIKDMVNKEMEDAKERVNEVVDETLQYAVEKTERASERISNEKIMAISEYSETVMADINKSHQEVMFLYDMLNDKHDNIKETVKQVDKAAKEVKEMAKDLEKESAPVAVPAALPSQPEPRKDEKFEVFNFVDQLPHIRKDDIAVVAGPEQPVQIPMQIPIQASPLTPVQLAKPEPPVVTLPEPVVVEMSERASEKKLEKTEMVENIVEQAVAVVETAPEQPEPENSNNKILELHKAGVSNVDIAKELGLGVGEVKLVINLFKGADKI